MEFKGTKNKWEVVGTFVYALNNEGTNTFSISINNDGKTSKEEQEANALLISKAPEMLGMLKLWCMDMEERGRAYGECYEMTKQLIKEATEL